MAKARRYRRYRDNRPVGCRTLAEYFEASSDTQTDVARQVGTSQTHISRIAAGRVIPRAVLAQRIVDYTGIPVDSFHKCWLMRRAMEAA